MCITSCKMMQMMMTMITMIDQNLSPTDGFQKSSFLVTPFLGGGFGKIIFRPLLFAVENWPPTNPPPFSPWFSAPVGRFHKIWGEKNPGRDNLPQDMWEHSMIWRSLRQWAPTTIVAWQDGKDALCSCVLHETKPSKNTFGTELPKPLP